MTTPRQYTNESNPDTFADPTRQQSEGFALPDRQADPAFRQPGAAADQDPALTYPSSTEASRPDRGPVPEYGAPAQGTPLHEAHDTAPHDTSVQNTASPRDAFAQDSSHQNLFAENDLSELRARWSDVQASFVDDPRSCVQQADGLVSSAVEQLTASFSQQRARLEDQWQRGEEASTEDLRIALQRYRQFFDRLLAV